VRTTCGTRCLCDKQYKTRFGKLCPAWAWLNIKKTNGSQSSAIVSLWLQPQLTHSLQKFTSFLSTREDICVDRSAQRNSRSSQSPSFLKISCFRQTVITNFREYFQNSRYLPMKIMKLQSVVNNFTCMQCGRKQDHCWMQVTQKCTRTTIFQTKDYSPLRCPVRNGVAQLQ
jgi:hypothetical protein